MQPWGRSCIEDETFLRLLDITFSSAERGVAVGFVRRDLTLSAPPVILLKRHFRSAVELGRRIHAGLN